MQSTTAQKETPRFNAITERYSAASLLRPRITWMLLLEREKKGGDGDWTSRIAVMVGALDLVEILLALFFL